MRRGEAFALKASRHGAGCGSLRENRSRGKARWSGRPVAFVSNAPGQRDKLLGIRKLQQFQSIGRKPSL
jgi:hypothetical protein